MRPPTTSLSILSFAGPAAAAVLLSSFAPAAVTPFSWIRGGEFGIMTDSSGTGHPFNAAFSSNCDGGAGGGGLTSALTSAIAAGGPLGTTGATSTVATRWGAFNCGNAGMWVQGANNSVPVPPLWGLPAVNWVMECWVLPVGTGANRGGTDAQFMSTGSGHFGGTPGGVAFRSHSTTDGEGNEVIELRADSLGTGAGIIGDAFPATTTAWTHLAVVNDNGVTTFYVNGVQNGDSRNDVTAPSGVPYIGSGQDTGGAFNGYLDELRYSTFEAGAFVLADLLLRPPGPGFISQPQSASVWEGGAAPFEAVMTVDPDNAFQWKRDDVDIPGATSPDYLLPSVTMTDNNSVFNLVVNNGTEVTTPDATLTVVPPETDNNNFFRSAIEAEASLLAYFPIDGSTTATVANTKDATHNATLQGGVSYDGRTDRSYGQRALRFRGAGNALVPANAAYEFADGTGTIEAIVRLDNPAAQHPKTVFSIATDATAIYYAIQIAPDGNSITYKTDVNPLGLSWAVSPSLLGRLAHVAVVFTPGKVTTFVDGVSLGIKDSTQFGISSGLQVNIGSVGMDTEGNPVDSWNGSIDELAIFGDALSDNTVAIHNSRFLFGTAVTAPSIVSSPIGTWNLLAGGAPIFRVNASGTAPLSYAWKRNDVPVAGNPTATTSTFTILDSTVASSGSYTVTVTNPLGEATSLPFTVNFTDPSPTDEYAGFVLADGPTAYWRLNETTGTVLTDYAGGHDGTYVLDNVDRGVDGPFGIDPDKSTHFKQAGTVSVSVPYTPTLNPSGAFSVEFWAKPDQSGNISRAILGTQNRNTGRAGYAIYQGFNGAWWEAHIGTAETVHFLQGTTAPAAGRWDHIVMTWDGSGTGNLYVNGALEGTATGGPHRNNLSQPLEIGSRFNGTVPYFGTIDEVAFYNYALTAEQIEHHFSIAYHASGITDQPDPVPNGVEAGTVTLVAGVTGFPNTYQWFKDNVALDAQAMNPDGTPKYTQGVAGTTLVISQAIPSDTGQYHLVITNALGNSATTPVTVTVALDTAPPTVAYVTASPTLNRVRVGFDKPMDPASLSPPANYTFTGGLTTTGVTLTNDSTVLDITTTGMVAGGNYSLSISGVRDTRISQNLIGVNNTPFSAYVLTQGALAWDYYLGITGTAVADLQGDGQFPAGVWTHQLLRSFDTMPITTNGDLGTNPAFGAALGQNYGVRMYGWITPTETSNYTFFLRSDDASELWISNDSNPNGLALAAFETGCCDPFKEEGEETSLPISMAAGQSYFVEALYKEGGGGDYLQVAWRKEGDLTEAATLTPIPGRFLSTYAPLLGTLNAPVIAGDQATITWTGLGILQESTNLAAWTDVPGNPPSGYVATVPPGETRFYRLRL